MKKIFNLIMMLLFITGCSTLEQKQYVDINGDYIIEKYLVCEGERVEVRKDVYPINFFSKNEVLPYIGESKSGEKYIGLEVRRLNNKIEEPLKMMTIIIDGESYNYYLLFEKSNFIKMTDGLVVEEIHIEGGEKILEKLSTAAEVKIKFIDHDSDTSTIMVGESRKISYKLIYAEYLKTNRV